MNPSPPSAIQDLHLLTKAFSQPGHASGTHQFNGSEPPHTDLFEELPEKYYDSAFIDRLHAYLPGWEIDVIRGEMFATGYGFIVDYLAEVLRHMRGQDRSLDYRDLFTLDASISTRDREGVQKTFSGLMKLLFPNGGATPEEIRELLTLSIEGRKRVKDQLMRIDSTYPEFEFSFADKTGRVTKVQTLEEREHPRDWHNLHRLVALELQASIPTPRHLDGQDWQSDSFCINCGQRHEVADVRHRMTKKGSDSWDLTCHDCGLTTRRTHCFSGCGTSLFKNGLTLTYHRTIADQLTNVACPCCGEFFDRDIHQEDDYRGSFG